MLEDRFHNNFHLDFETDRLPYHVKHHYTPDWKVADNVFIETKGLFTSADRTKLKYVRQQHPGIIIALVFQKLQGMATPKQTNQQWCEKNGFVCYDEHDIEGIEAFIQQYQVSHPVNG